MSRENIDRNEHMGTADLLGRGQAQRDADDAREAAHREQMQMEQPHHPPPEAVMPQTADPQGEPLAPLFPAQLAGDFRQRWDAVQIGFVDDPRRAVQQADELVAEVMKNLAASFADQRSRLEAGLGHDGQAGTEDLRMALRGYRSFFMRLLSV